MQGTIKTAAQPKLHRVHDTISRHNKQKKTRNVYMYTNWNGTL